MPTVLVYWAPGRTPEQKAKVVRGITDALVEHGGARREDVLIIFQNIEAGDAGRAGEITPARLPASTSPPGNGHESP